MIILAKGKTPVLPAFFLFSCHTIVFCHLANLLTKMDGEINISIFSSKITDFSFLTEQICSLHLT